MDNQLAKVSVSPLTHHRLPGPTFQSRESHHISSSLILSFSYPTPIPSVHDHGHACKENFIHHQLHLAFRSLYPSWTPAAQISSVLDKATLGPTQAILWHSITTECRIPISPALVQQTGCSPGSSSASTGTQPVLLHWCIPNRLGSQLARSSPLRTVVSSGLQSAHQLAGTRSHPISCSQVGTTMDQSDGSRLLRQQYSSRSYTQAGRDPFHISVQQNSGTLSSSGPVWDSSHSNSPPRNVTRSKECYRRCPVSTQQSKSDRMAASSGNLTQAVLCLRNPLMHMFATDENRVTPIYISPYPDDRAWVVDALSISWDGLRLVYAFPPAPIVPKTLQKIKDSHGTTMILIASQHPSCLWHPLLLLLNQHPHTSLTYVAIYQYVPNMRWPQFHREPHLLDLAAWLLSGTSSNNMISQILS